MQTDKTGYTSYMITSLIDQSGGILKKTVYR